MSLLLEFLFFETRARRAAALYWWMVREGYEDARTLAEAPARPRKSPENHVRAVDVGMLELVN